MLLGVLVCTCLGRMRREARIEPRALGSERVALSGAQLFAADLPFLRQRQRRSRACRLHLVCARSSAPRTFLATGVKRFPRCVD